MDNTSVLQGILLSLSEVTAKKTSLSFAQMVVENILHSLQRKFPFLADIHFENDSSIYIPSKVNSLENDELGKIIEAIIRLVYMNLEKQAGLFFISEIETNAPPGVIPKIREIGVDLELMQIEHHQIYRNKPNQLNESKNTHNQKLKQSNSLNQNEKTQKISSDEFRFLKILKSKDVDTKEVIDSLQISHQQLDEIIVNLLNAEYLHYISEDEVKLTNKAITFLNQQEEHDQPML
jgi:hypothetical protein